MLSILMVSNLVRNFGKLVDFVNPVTGRIHASFKVSGTNTGRFTCSKPNLQQLPTAKRSKRFRRVIVAQPDYVLIGADWSQVEMRAGAWFSGDPALTAIYAEEKDLHRITAGYTLGIDPDKVTDDSAIMQSRRIMGRSMGFSANGLSEDAFANYDIRMTVEEAQAQLDAFFALFSVFDEWRYEKPSSSVRLKG